MDEREAVMSLGRREGEGKRERGQRERHGMKM